MTVLLGSTGSAYATFEQGAVKKLRVEHHKKYRKRNNTQAVEGIYFDRYSGKWRTDDGQVCHSCTPENGFPKHPR